LAADEGKIKLNCSITIDILLFIACV